MDQSGEPSIFTFAGIFNLTVLGELFLAVEKCAAVDYPVVMADGQQMIVYTLILPLVCIPLDRKSVV